MDKIYTAVILLLALIASAQQPFGFGDLGNQVKSGATAAASWNPTNNADGSSYFVVLDPDTLSSSPVSTWTDSTTNAWNFVGLSTAQPAWTSSQLNGHSIVQFDGSNDRLVCAAINRSGMELGEWIWVVRWTNNAANAVLCDSTNSGLIAKCVYKNGAGININDGSNCGTTPLITNAWQIIRAVYGTNTTGSYSFIMTNGVILAAGTSGCNTLNGISLGENKSGAVPANVDVAYGLLCLGRTNTVTQWSNVFNFITNRFDRSNFPGMP